MLPTSSLALIVLMTFVTFVTWSMGLTLRALPEHFRNWLHTRRLRKLDLREAQARARKAEAEADSAEEAVDDGNVKKLYKWLDKAGTSLN